MLRLFFSELRWIVFGLHFAAVLRCPFFKYVKHHHHHHHYNHYNHYHHHRHQCVYIFSFMWTWRDHGKNNIVITVSTTDSNASPQAQIYILFVYILGYVMSLLTHASISINCVDFFLSCFPVSSFGFFVPRCPSNWFYFRFISFSISSQQWFH